MQRVVYDFDEGSWAGGVRFSVEIDLRRRPQLRLVVDDSRVTLNRDVILEAKQLDFIAFPEPGLEAPLRFHGRQRSAALVTRRHLQILVEWQIGFALRPLRQLFPLVEGSLPVRG